MDELLWRVRVWTFLLQLAMQGEFLWNWRALTAWPRCIISSDADITKIDWLEMSPQETPLKNAIYKPGHSVKTTDVCSSFLLTEHSRCF